VVTHDYLRSWLDKAWKKQVPSVGIPRHEPLSRFSFAQPPPTQIPIVQIGVQIYIFPPRTDFPKNKACFHLRKFQHSRVISPRDVSPKMANQSPAARSPIWIPIIRGIQILLSLIILGLSGDLIHGLYFNALGFAIFCVQFFLSYGCMNSPS
jgi:hypothetical protein